MLCLRGNIRKTSFALLMVLSIVPWAHSQTNVMAAFVNTRKQADTNYHDGNYVEAIAAYESILSREPQNTPVRLKLARSYYRMKNYQKAVELYAPLVNDGDALPSGEFFTYAEAQAALGHYDVAMHYYKRCLEENADDIIANKLWRLDNLSYLYEDTAHYAVRIMKVNTTFSEFGAVPYRDGIVFTSNRKTKSNLIDQVDGKRDLPFYQLLTTRLKKDTITLVDEAGRPERFARAIQSNLNTGPAAFYHNFQNMVFVSALGSGAKRTLGLHFAVLKQESWSVTNSFLFNGADYSIYDVTISEDGSRMFFSSDMKGGYGGKDIYESVWKDGRWSKPVNAGAVINTPMDEVSPFFHHADVLYFSSNGHAGVGELDIFKANVKVDGFDEPQNLGFPINSSMDDFGIWIDSLSSHGYFSSNRSHGGFDDDIYEFDIDLQRYPFLMTGVVRFKEQLVGDSTSNLSSANIKVMLMDSWKGTQVGECITDAQGNFSMSIPYYSKYFIQIVDSEGIAHKASLELQKYNAASHAHEIVVVKEMYNSTIQK